MIVECGYKYLIKSICKEHIFAIKWVEILIQVHLSNTLVKVSVKNLQLLLVDYLYLLIHKSTVIIQQSFMRRASARPGKYLWFDLSARHLYQDASQPE